MSPRRRSVRSLIRRLHRLDELSVRLARVIETLDEAERRVRRRAPPRPRALVRGLRRSIEEALEVVRLFSLGFGAEHQRRAATGAGEQARGIAPLVEYPQRGALAAFRLFTLFASAELELFVRDYANWWLTSSEVARFQRRHSARKSYPGHARDPAVAKQQIIDWLKPSAPHKAPSWPSRARAVFRCQTDAPMAETIVTLIAWRNEFAHLGRRRHRIRWNGTDVGEAMVACLLAFLVLGVRLGEASFNRLS